MRNLKGHLASISNRGVSRGFMIIELLLVVIVIALLSGWYFRDGGSPEQQAASQYKVSMDRSKAAACMASRTSLRTQIVTYSMQHPGEQLTTEGLARSGINLNVCPEGGTITVGPDGTLHCSVHDQQAGQP